MIEKDLHEIYLEITGVPAYADDPLPQLACVECIHRLNNCNLFRNKCRRAHRVLQEIIDNSDNVSMDKIKNIDRDSALLTSNLTKVVNINSYDCSLVYNDANETIKQLKFEEHYSSDVEYKSVDTIENNIDINDDDAIINNEHPLFLEIDTDNTSRHTTSKDSNVEQNGVNVSQKWDDIRILWRGRKRRPRARTGFKDSLEDKFVITDLTYEEQLAEVHKRRESANYKNSTYRCTLCFKGFLDEDAFKAHMMRHTRFTPEDIRNTVKSIKRGHILTEDLKDDYDIERERRALSVRSNMIARRALARSHDRWHDGKKFHCQHCSQEFNTLTTYMSHLRIKHPTDFVCELCGYSFVSEKGKYQHRSLKHRLDDFQIPDDGPRCEKCNIQFRSDEAYEKHISVSLRHTVHTTIRPHQCELCGKCFKTPHEKKSHCDYVHLKKPWPRKSRGKLNVKDTVKVKLVCF
ncbi:zinc finger protein 724-like [Leptidea sinapis]|uniref:zinc finger protein 724-like n=1 Tax=Leptidea sinapis TaxID=189913 RepID=UPI0021C46835|nr:zinc finger protein 724-like [Leptidea sinapis]